MFPTPRRNPTLGITMLDTPFQRLAGDIGNAATWPPPVHYAVVRGATRERVLSPSTRGTLELFLKAADDLVALGVDGIPTSCGFLAIHPAPPFGVALSHTSRNVGTAADPVGAGGLTLW